VAQLLQALRPELSLQSDKLTGLVLRILRHNDMTL